MKDCNENMSYLAEVHEEVALRKQEAYEILRTFFSDEEIEKLCTLLALNHPSDDNLWQIFENDNEARALCDKARSSKQLPPHVRKNLNNIILLSTRALVLYMGLETQLPPTGDGYVVQDEELGYFLMGAMSATLMLREASWGAAYPLAETRLKQLRQPPTRNRHENQKSDIEDEFTTYCKLKKKAPNTFNDFLNYLESSGYTIDNAAGSRGTIDQPGRWNRPRSLATVGDWYNELKRTHQNSPRE